MAHGAKDSNDAALNGALGARLFYRLAGVHGTENPHFWQHRPEVGHPVLGRAPALVTEL